jgi:hypothetical protein
MSHHNTIYNQILHPEINSGHQFERLIDKIFCGMLWYANNISARRYS